MALVSWESSILSLVLCLYHHPLFPHPTLPLEEDKRLLP